MGGGGGNQYREAPPKKEKIFRMAVNIYIKHRDFTS